MALLRPWSNYPCEQRHKNLEAHTAYAIRPTRFTLKPSSVSIRDGRDGPATHAGAKIAGAPPTPDDVLLLARLSSPKPSLRALGVSAHLTTWYLNSDSPEQQEREITQTR